MRWLMLRITLCITLLTVGCDDYVYSPAPDNTLPSANMGIGQLHGYLTQSHVATINDDVVVVGRVTSSDEASNFFRSITIEDESGGMELLIGGYELHATYPEGLKVALRLRGCTVGYRYGTLQAGSKAETYNNLDIEYIATRQAIDQVVLRSHDVEPITAPRRHIADLDNSMCGRLVRIDSLQLIGSTTIDTLAGEPLEWATWSEYSMFEDSNHDTIVVYTRQYARYATQHIPTTTLSLQGIVQYAKHPANNRNYYQLKMRDERDCIHN